MWSAEPAGVKGATGCRTACGDAGCECQANTPLQYHDHIALVAADGTHLSCLCGDFQVRTADLPPVMFGVGNSCHKSKKKNFLICVKN